MATSVPVPIARPRSAWASAAASLTPSPTIATTRPSAWRRRPRSTFSAGSTSAITSSIPTSAATARAVASLSPVSSTGRSPSSRSAAIASRLVGLTVSATTNRPRTSPSQPTSDRGLPARFRLVPSASSSAGVAHGPQSASRRRGRPTTAWPSTIPSTPSPSRLAKLLDRGQRPDLRLGRASAIARRDRVLGGVLDAHRRGAAPRPRRRPAPATTATSDISPLVTVPVLSRTTVSTRRVDSSTSGPLIRMPELGAAAGADQQRGRRGQAERAGAGDDQDRDGGGEGEGRAARRRRARRRAWRAARAMTTGTNTAETRSASRCTGAFPDWASVTRRAIWPARSPRRPGWRGRRGGRRR